MRFKRRTIKESRKKAMKTKLMTVTLKPKTGVMVPPSILRKAGLKSGDRIDFKVSGRVISILPEFPNADDEYTPAQRRVIDARLAKAMKGPFYGPFDTVAEMIADMKARTKKRSKRP